MKTVKIEMPKESYDFLVELAETMQLQNNRGGNSPVGYCIRNNVRDWRVDVDSSDGHEWHDRENCESMDVGGLLEDEGLLDSFFENSGVIASEFDQEDEFYLSEFEEYVEDNFNNKYEKVYYRDRMEPVYGEVFLTDRAAKAHLKSNSHHYNGSADTYGFTFDDRCFDEIRKLCFLICGFSPKPYNSEASGIKGGNHAYGPYLNKFPKIKVLQETK